MFSPRFYATEYLNSPRGYIITPNMSRIRAAVREAFSRQPGARSPSASAWAPRRPRSGSTTPPAGPGSRPAPPSTSRYYGLEASAPNKRIAEAAPKTEIDGLQRRRGGAWPETIAYLEKLYGTTVETATDPSVTVDVIVTLGRDAPDLEVEPVG